MPNAKARKPIVVIPSDDERRLAHLLPFAAFIARARESLQWHLATGWHPVATQFPFFAKNSKALPKWHHCSTSGHEEGEALKRLDFVMHHLFPLFFFPRLSMAHSRQVGEPHVIVLLYKEALRSSERTKRNEEKRRERQMPERVLRRKEKKENLRLP